MAFAFPGSQNKERTRNALAAMYVWVARDTDMLPLNDSEGEETA